MNIILMGNWNETGLKQEIQKVQQQNEEQNQELKKIQDMLIAIQTEFRIALGQVLMNQELAKPVQDEILKFTDEWFGTKFKDFGFPQ